MSENGGRPFNSSRSERIRAVDAAIAELMAELHDALDDEDDDFEEVPTTPRSAPYVSSPEVELPATPGYRRDRLGRWRYERSNAYVPGARDARIGELYGRLRDDEHVYLPTAVLRAVPMLAAFRTYPVCVHGAISCVMVPVGEWGAHAATPAGLSAPEIAPWHLVDTVGFAALLNVAPRTISSYLARQQVPEPLARVASSPVWSIPVLLDWLASRGR